MLLADISFGDIIWSMLVFFFWFMWIMILFYILGDLFRDRELSGGMKAVWIIFLIVATPITTLVYLIARGNGMTERQIAAQQDAQKQFASYVQTVSGGGGAAGEIASAKALLDSGAINQSEFDALKAKALA